MSQRVNMTCMGTETTEDERYYATGTGSWGKNSTGTLDELNFSHTFDYNAIEQIANGLEKMVRSWSAAQEERAQGVTVCLDEDFKGEVSLDVCPLKDEYIDVGVAKSFKSFGFPEKKAGRVPSNFEKSRECTAASQRPQGQQRREFPKAVVSSDRTTPQVLPLESGGSQKASSLDKGSMNVSWTRMEKENNRVCSPKRFPREMQTEVTAKHEVSPTRDTSPFQSTRSNSPKKSLGESSFVSYAQHHSENSKPFEGTLMNKGRAHTSGFSTDQTSLFSKPAAVKEAALDSSAARKIPEVTQQVSRLPPTALSHSKNLSHQHFDNVDTSKISRCLGRNSSASPERSARPNTRNNDCTVLDSDAHAVEMQKVYIDVATNLERSFSQRECSTASNGNSAEEYVRVVTQLFQDPTASCRNGKGQEKTSSEEPPSACKDFVPSQTNFSEPSFSQGDRLVELQKDFSRAAATLERQSFKTEEQPSARESLEMQNSSTLISTRGKFVEAGSNANLFGVEDIVEASRYSASRSETKERLAEAEQADDTFVTSSSYWCVEPETVNEREEETYEKQRPHGSFTNDASYEKADFNTSNYEERPLKRKKETLELGRSIAYESEYETPSLDDVGTFAYIVDPSQPCISETVVFDEDCFDQVQERRFAAFARNLSSQVEVDSDDSKDAYKTKVEELQIALLECAAEYEVKMVEMEMKMLQLKSKYQLLEQEPQQGFQKSEKEWTTKRLENYRKQNIKLQREKEILSKDIVELRKKERQLDLLRKNLDDSLQKVNTLQRELVKKEEELVDSQLKEKEAKAHLYQVEAALQHAEASQIDQGCVLNLLMALSQWLQNVKKASLVKFDPRQQLQIQQYEESLSKLMDEYIPQKAIEKFQAPPQLGFLSPSSAPVSPHSSDCHSDTKRDKEVQALQNELERLASKRTSF